MMASITGALVALGILAAPVAPPAPAAEGPQCTYVYPRGFKVPKITKKKPVCKGGHIESTWRGCELRYKA
jgi:hypothetical protein